MDKAEDIRFGMQIECGEHSMINYPQSGLVRSCDLSVERVKLGI